METIGEKLHKARIERGLTIGDLQKITKIQRRYLEAIEKDDFNAMPSDYYKRTFVRQFADAVGLNPRPLLRRLDGEPENDVNSNTTSLNLPVKGSRKSKYNETNTKRALISSYIPIALLVLSVLIIIGTIVWAIVIDSEKGPIVPTPNKTTVVSAGQTSESSTENSAKSTSESSLTEETTSSTEQKEEKKNTFTLVSDDGSTVHYQVENLEKPIKLTLKGLNGAAWFGIQSPTTKEVVYQYTLKANETFETEVPEDLSDFNISLGAPTNLTIAVNGEELKFNEKTYTTEPKTIVIEQKTTTSQSSSTEEDKN